MTKSPPLERAEAWLIQCSRRHVYTLMERSQFLKPFKVGALSRWRLASIHYWLDTGLQSGSINGELKSRRRDRFSHDHPLRDTPATAGKRSVERAQPHGRSRRLPVQQRAALSLSGF